MKKNHRSKNDDSANELASEYRFDYSKAKPNRFAARYQAGSRVVVLEPDVAKVFTSAQSVNDALRKLLKPKRTEYALVIHELKNGESKVERIAMEVDRTRRPASPEKRKKIKEFLARNRKAPKNKRTK